MTAALEPEMDCSRRWGHAAQPNVAAYESGRRAASPEMHPDVPWSLIKKMRYRLAHRYEGTDYEAVWDMLVNDLPVIDGYVRQVVAA